jgi:hypothetical protein
LRLKLRLRLRLRLSGVYVLMGEMGGLFHNALFEPIEPEGVYGQGSLALYDQLAHQLANDGCECKAVA